MFDRFQQAVRNAYLEPNTTNPSQHWKAKPTTGSLKKYCLEVCGKGLSVADKEVFTNFFKPQGEQPNLESAIRTFDPDKFRPLVSFITQNRNITDETAVKLLAVLIDFQPRPYQGADWTDDASPSNTMESQRLINTTATDAVDSSPITLVGVSVEETTDEKKATNIPPVKPKSTAYAIKRLYLSGGIILLIVSFASIYFRPNKQCMSWTGDRYIEVDCDYKHPHYDVIALDEPTLKNFKKIDRPDTLTNKDINRVWYSKIDNEVEFFTAAGSHPVNRRKPLRAMSQHILIKYAKKQINPEPEKAF